MAFFKRGAVWIAAGAVLMFLVLAFLDRRPRATTPILGAWETDPAAWGRLFPREYQSWRQTREPVTTDIGYGPGRTKWGGAGSARQEPSQLFAGYDQARGVTLAADKPRHPVGCQGCHDPRTMALRLTQPAFLDALAEHGRDPARLSQQELKSYVCAQCHVTRFFGWTEGKPLIPLTAAGIIAAAEKDELTDWNHTLSAAPLLKVRHPEFELWSLGIHAQRGVACVDCHMPYQAEGSVRVTDHRMRSPLLEVFASCAPCHRRGEQELQRQVEAIQDTTMALQQRVGEALQGAHRAVGEAGQAGVSEDRLKPLRALLRQAQTRWDFIASEHSAGFHAPQEAAQQLGIALDQARQAEILAQKMR